MPVLLVRHAQAWSRSDWDGDDRSRELTTGGHRQAQGLVELVAAFEPKRVFSSPARRCVDTVALLGRHLGLQVEAEPRLEEGSGQAAVELVRSLAGADVVLCSHGDVIPEVLAAVAAEDGLDLGPAPRVDKASVWVLRGGAGRFDAAEYLSPPIT